MENMNGSSLGMRRPSGRLTGRCEPLEARRLFATFLVTTTADVGPGSLRQALVDANLTPATDAIHFSLPAGAGGVATIMPVLPLPPAVFPVDIDGRAQPGYAGTPLVEINGTTQRVGDGLVLAGGPSSVRGLAVTGFFGNAVSLQGGGGHVVEANYIGVRAGGATGGGSGVGVHVASGSNTVGGLAATARNVISNNDDGVVVTAAAATANQILGNYIGTTPNGSGRMGNRFGGVVLERSAAGNVIGGTAAGARNVISANETGVLLTPGAGAGNVIQGNYIGTNAAGTSALGNTLDGVTVRSAGNQIGGAAAGAGNLISGNGETGVYLLESGARNNVIEGNRIGTDAAGNTAVPNGYYGVIAYSGASSNRIGGTAAGAGNLVSGNANEGVVLTDGANDNRVEGNRIGTNAAGTGSLPNLKHQVRIENASGNTVGGTAAGAGNVIAHAATAGYDGVRLVSGTGNGVLGNSIYSNAGLGIDLGPDGVTPNDVNGSDADAGANNQQNFPILTTATAGGAAAAAAGRVWGSLDSAPNTTYRIEFFASPAADPGGYGEGRTFLGSTSVATDAAGRVSFSAPLPPTPDLEISATATDPNNNTSEFSQSVRARTRAVVDRRTFYNRSVFDGNDPAANRADDNAIAPDKHALLPGLTAAAANVTSYGRGINGVMIDVANLAAGQLQADDFEFRVVHPNNVASWTPAPEPAAITVRPGVGAGGADRVTITWPDGAVSNTWLQVTVWSTGDTGLTAPDVFAFGNLIADADGGRTVNLGDFGALRQDFGKTNVSLAGGRADFNRDGAVNLADFGLLRANFGKSLPAPPPSPAASWASSVSSAADEDENE